MDPELLRQVLAAMQQGNGSVSGGASDDPRMVALQSLANPKPFIPGVPDPDSRESESYMDELYESDDQLSPYENAQMQASLGGGPGPTVMTPELERKRYAPHQRMGR